MHLDLHASGMDPLASSSFRLSVLTGPQSALWFPFIWGEVMRVFGILAAVVCASSLCPAGADAQRYLMRQRLGIIPVSAPVVPPKDPGALAKCGAPVAYNTVSNYTSSDYIILGKVADAQAAKIKCQAASAKVVACYMDYNANDGFVALAFLNASKVVPITSSTAYAATCSPF
jgi:hypothetical protein